MQALGTRVFLGGGDFVAVAGVARAGVASLDVSGSAPVLESWAPLISSDVLTYRIISLDVSPQVVLIAGNFTAVGGQRRWGVAALDPQSGHPLPWAPQLMAAYPAFNSYFVELAGNRVWVSGTILGVNGQPRAGMAAFDLQGRLMPWSPSDPITESTSPGPNNTRGTSRTTCTRVADIRLKPPMAR